MKKGTSKHPKTIRLSQRLDISRVHARGVLGELWEWVGEYYSDGDISEATTREIADAVDWRGDADVLVLALISTRWLDGEIGGRLVIHDWTDHCADWIKKRVRRLKSRPGGPTADQRRTNGGPTAAVGVKQGVAKPSSAKGESVRGGKRECVGAALLVQTGDVLALCGEPLPDLLQGPSVGGAIVRWFQYKNERKEKYTPTGARALVAKLAKWGGAVRVVPAIEHSMANNWAGIYEPNQRDGPKAPEDVPEYLRDVEGTP